METIFNYIKNTHELFFDLLFQFLIGMAGAAFFYYFVASDKAIPKIGMVNVTSIVNTFIKEEAKKNLTPDQIKLETIQFGKKLETELQNLSKNENVTIFPSEAVIAGSTDYTLFIQSHISSNK